MYCTVLNYNDYIDCIPLIYNITFFCILKMILRTICVIYISQISELIILFHYYSFDALYITEIDWIWANGAIVHLFLAVPY